MIVFLIGFVILALASTVEGQLTIGFDELDPPKQGDGDHYFDGYGANASSGFWSSQSAVFNTNMFGPGFSYSSVNNVTTAGFGNQWAAITGVDRGGAGNYVLANTFIEDGAFIDLPVGWRVDSLFVTNSTFAFLSMLNGDSFAKQFGGSDGNDPDFFMVKFRGFSESGTDGRVTGEVDFYLADFRFADNKLDYIVDTWDLVDLNQLGNAKSIGLSFESSDVGEFGINTPVYVVLDDLTMLPIVLLGDINLDGAVDLLDIAPFVDLLGSQSFQQEADVNEDGVVDLLDVAPFVAILAGK